MNKIKVKKIRDWTANELLGSSQPLNAPVFRACRKCNKKTQNYFYCAYCKPIVESNMSYEIHSDDPHSYAGTFIGIEPISELVKEGVQDGEI